MKSAKYYISTLFALALSIVPPMIAAISYFPFWMDKGDGAIISGFTVMLLLIAVIPLFKLIKRMLASPSILFIWLMIYLLFSAAKNIADEMTVIAFVGVVSNTVSTFIFKITERYGKRKV